MRSYRHWVIIYGLKQWACVSICQCVYVLDSSVNGASEEY